MYNRVTVDLIEELKAVVGDKNVIVEKELMQDYSHDELSLPELWNLPEVVVKPVQETEISEILKIANREKIPVVPKGGGTGLCGGSIPTMGGIVISMENIRKVLEIDEDNLMAVVEAGLTLKDFYTAIESRGLYFPPHPGEESADIGGLIATNAGGARAIKHGVIRNFVRGLRVVLPRGEIIRLGGKIVKNSTGYSLLNLMIGSEGTLGIITEATIGLLPPPAKTFTLIIPYDSLHEAIKTVPEILKKKILPLAVEFVEKELITVTEKMLDKKWPCRLGNSYLMVIIEGSNDNELENMAESISEVCLANNALDVFVADTPEKQKNVLDIRSQIYSALKPHTLEILDTIVPRSEIANHVDRIHQISDIHNMWLPIYGHAADGNVHAHLMKAKFINDNLDSAEIPGWQEKYQTVREEIYKDALLRGGTISGEHGIGITKAKYLEMALGKSQITLMKAIKTVFDPLNILNPGKIF